MNKKDIRPGDRVVVRQWDDMEKEFGLSPSGHINCRCTFMKSMRYLCGRELVIEKIALSGACAYLDGWTISTDMVEPVYGCRNIRNKCFIRFLVAQ